MQLISLQENQQSRLFWKTTPFSNTSASTKSNEYTFPEDHQRGEGCTKDLSVLSKTEATVNNRPLTYVESDTTPTSPTASTPSHLIKGPILSTLPYLREPEDNITEKDLGHMQANQKLFCLTQLQQIIWNRWKIVYSSFLRERQEVNKRNFE